MINKQLFETILQTFCFLRLTHYLHFFVHLILVINHSLRHSACNFFVNFLLFHFRRYHGLHF